MLINNNNMSRWGASLSEKLITPAIKQAVNQDGITLYHESISKKIYLKILFEGVTRDIIDKNISNYSVETSKEFTIKLKNKETFFKCKPASFTVEETGFNNMLYIAAEYDCIEYEAEKVITSTETTVKFNASGNTNTPCILELTPSIDLISLSIEGLSEEAITIKNLKGNKTLIINSEAGTVELEGINYYTNFNAWEFPEVKAGANSVKISNSGINIKIRYKAIWN